MLRQIKLRKRREKAFVPSFRALGEWDSGKYQSISRANDPRIFPKPFYVHFLIPSRTLYSNQIIREVVELYELISETTRIKQQT
nr:unnamed protein product [Haemonchus contortus]